eukprot:CAMPEP_0201574018 /NCGR_PEP_ID=MMETSP0190_2-20130828/18211_1 /ASSEMBLY_ACC=CAM_ASM_000263 /TAXON_ID=37353 /ORGANISM="Rosalina sp." /LENGTH=108 /DNA_ID=CAMNT_0048001673 /DNA_START=238 /DNA_END=561 /DNA_ORIENTATION=+
MEIINFVMQKLESLYIGFVCDYVMKEVIRNDLMDIAKRLIDNRWHKITEEDELHAQLVDGECNSFLIERSKAFNINDINTLNQNEDIIDLDDDEWEDNNDDFSENDDW